MNAQTFMNSRRKFLERSAMGAGGLLFSSMLLASCTDHNILDPQNPDFPTLFDPQIDWNDDAKTMVASCIEMIPEVGDILGGLVDIFWPSSKPDLWGQIRAQVEALVDQKIEQSIYEQTYDDLTGLKNQISDYLSYIQANDDDMIKLSWGSIRGSFSDHEPHFQSPSYQLPLLPLFAQFANMYLAHLRDGWLNGRDWGLNNQDVEDIRTQLADKIVLYQSYILGVYNAQRTTLISKWSNPTSKDLINCEPFRSINPYDRQMTLTVLDFMELWNYFLYIPETPGPFNPFPKKVSVVSPREVYSDPYGNCGYSGNIFSKLNTPPTQPISAITLQSTDQYINTVTVTYPAGGGPGGADQTSGGYTGGTKETTITPVGYNILAARVQYGKVKSEYVDPTALQFQYADGSTTDTIGGGGTDSGWLGYPGKALSRVHVNGGDPVQLSADSIVFGFKDIPTDSQVALTTVKLNSIKSLYVKAPTERSADDFVKAYPNLPANLISDELKAARKKYWESFNQ
ncbi:insecticidal delta-endotoxin Cry8Ea1 family protein [Dyadobacter bucti]|uniref:insecticidal delta-endotoxin Cry8Ea1 family protein n=1 Tax=Dyadobacter bucti TaxID=2572203 RepID=UPI003F708DA7